MIALEPLTAERFAPFGDVIEASGTADKIINQGLCGRYHDRARLDFSDGRAGISVFDAEIRALPYELEMMERHPLGSQAFLPLGGQDFMVTVALNTSGTPGTPLAFRAKGGQGVNIHRNVWHGVLTPLTGPGRFAVVDRIGAGDNLEEHWFEVPYLIG